MAASPSTEWPSAKIRQTFLDYFATRRDHTIVPSAPCVPLDDPTLLFANAGMNQFKPIFLGQVDPASPLAALTRAADTQKCIRAGGKHNDLEDVGKDTYHHTFFEMLGNWSFGDYFKTEAIEYAYDLLVNVYQLPAGHLYATYFGGDEALGLEADLEARDLWLRYLPPERVLPFGSKDNFWEMGDVGPCGPCTEIHFDRLGATGRDAAGLVNADDPNVIEIWNLVFIQYNREASGLTPLPNKHVDTGMGFERVASILQDKTSNYDTDIFVPIFDAISNATGCRPYSAKIGKDDTDGVDLAYRVVADHIRTLTFAITDGAVPSNDGRGYVLRRILRRAVRYGQQFLKGKTGFFADLIDPLVAQMSEAFPELASKKDFVKEIVLEEEQSFSRTLDRGIERFKKMSEDVGADRVLSGKDAFFLYDTMGFPLDLTQLMAEERDMTVDVTGFEQAMAEAKEISRRDRANRSGLGGKPLVLEAFETDALQKDGVQATDDSPKYVWHKDIEATVKAIFAADKGFLRVTTDVDDGTPIGIILDRTSYYAEAGGQVADTGKLVLGSSSFEVLDCQVFAGFVMHKGVVEAGKFSVGDQISVSVDYTRRSRIAPNHTMTHVLNFALREVLGDSVDQKGSLVDPSKLRFDFSNTKALSEDQVRQVETICQEKVASKLSVHTKVVSLASAKAIHSLRAVFGEVYPDPVRVVSIGQDVDALVSDPENETWRALSIEFCGGTHLTNTSEATNFALLEEGAIAKGIRRVVGVTGDAAVSALEVGAKLKGDIKEIAALPDEELPAALNEATQRVNAAATSLSIKYEVRKELSVLSERSKKAQKKLAAAKEAKVMAEATLMLAQAQEADRTFVVVVPGLEGDAKLTGKVAEKLLKEGGKQGTLVISCVAPTDKAPGRILVFAAVTDDAVKKGIKANEWANAALSSLGGKGGGKPKLAQANAVGLQNPSEHVEQITNDAAAFASKYDL